MTQYDTIIIGGGFFGMYIAEYFAKKGQSVLICEKEADFMLRAAYHNQARVHNGYHYPRSVLTALRSRISFPKFCDEFPDCIDNSFDKIYATGRILGKITASQFERFCRRIGAVCEPAGPAIKAMFNSRLIDGVFSTVEYAFNADKLRLAMRRRIEQAGVNYRLNTTAAAISQAADGSALAVKILLPDGQSEVLTARQAFNCTYSMINYSLFKSGLDIIPLKHEMTEMCLVDVPLELKNKGITIMCGPFFSVMPFPARGLHSLSHVRYTPHFNWFDEPGKPYINAHRLHSEIPKQSAYPAMLKDAARYIPLVEGCRYVDSLWEVKTILPLSETDDSRPILFKTDCGLKNLHSVMGGKIDNVYDVIDFIEKNFAWGV